MHEGRRRRSQQMIVKRRDVDTTPDELFHYRAHFVGRQHEVAHNHCLVTHFLECKPGPERECRFDLDSVERHLEVAAGPQPRR